MRAARSEPAQPVTLREEQKLLTRRLFVEAAKRVQGDLTPEALRDEIEATAGWIGIDGTYNMTAEDHNGLTVEDLTMYEISGGKFTPAQ